MGVNAIADEVHESVVEEAPITLTRILTNEYFLYVVSFVLFLYIWNWVAAAHILGKSLATPREVLKELARLMTVTLAGASPNGAATRDAVTTTASSL